LEVTDEKLGELRFKVLTGSMEDLQAVLEMSCKTQKVLAQRVLKLEIELKSIKKAQKRGGLVLLNQ